LIMIRVPKAYAKFVLEYLDDNVGANQPYSVPEHESTDMSRFNPHYVDSHLAIWKGKGDTWSITQSPRQTHIEVECKDSKHETIIAIRWGS